MQVKPGHLLKDFPNTNLQIYFKKTMTPDEFLKQLQSNSADIKKAINRTIPVKMCNTAMEYFRESFIKSGWEGNAWKKTRRQESGDESAAANYKPLTSSRNHLMSNFTKEIAPGKSIVRNKTEYAEINNNGGTINTHPNITTQMRKMAWARFFKAKESGNEAEAGKWKGLALTKKTQLNIKAVIPQRQFMGESETLRTECRNIITKELTKIIKK